MPRSSVSANPLMLVSGVRSSWLIIETNWVFISEARLSASSASS